MKRILLVILFISSLLNRASSFAQTFYPDPDSCPFGEQPVGIVHFANFDICNETGVTANYTVSIISNPSGFMTHVDPTSGSLPHNYMQEVYVWINTSGLTPGQSYNGTVRVVGTNIGQQFDVPVSLTIKQDETVSKPTWMSRSGSGSVEVGTSINFSTGGASSNLGHSIEYQYDWGDGSQSSWGSSSRSHSFNDVGNYTVRSRARCQTHTSVVSEGRYECSRPSTT